TWSSGMTSVIANNGTVTRPAYGSGNTTVTVTATISKGSTSSAKTFTMIVLETPQADAQAVATDKASLVDSAIKGSNTALNNVTGNLSSPLPSTGASGTTITWSSNNTGVIANNGTVTRPSFSSGDATVTFSATISKGAASDTKAFSITVIKAPQSADDLSVSTDKTSLVNSTIQGSNADLNNVKVNLYFPTTGASGTTITWSSSNTGVIANNGMVTRPASGTADVVVTITATISKGSATDTKTFTVTVKQLTVSSYTITYDINGGSSGSMSVQTIDSGASAVLLANAFIRPSYIFSGWATTPTGGVAYNDKQNYTMGSSNVTLYAVWTLSSSLLIKYNFDGQNCNDSSGNGRHGTANNITYISDGNGGYAASLNGSTSYITLPGSTIYNQAAAFTVMMRFKTTTGGCLLGYQNNSVGSVPTQFVPIITVLSNGILRGELWMGSSLVVSSSVAVNDGKWHTVYFSAKASSIALYLDGAQVAAPAVGTVQHLSMTLNQIGTGDGAVRAYMPNSDGASNFWYYFNGQIDDFYFYSTALH
ncbi:MAG TPA: immunoglobulin-like domain-containing protein, partial [Spirochaetota bacterium]